MSNTIIDLPAGAPGLEDPAARRRSELGEGLLRERVARGTLINTVFLVAMSALSLVQGLVVARALGAREYGLWGLLAMTFGTLFALAAVGVDDKYIQQDHPDQTAAFELAFTLQFMLCGLFAAIALIAVPLFALLYRQPVILVPGLLLAAVLPMVALQTPMWVFYRRMNFGRQRLLESINPVISFVVIVTLAVVGVGFWSLVIGSLVGAFVAAAVAIANAPYRLRFRYESGALRDYATFSWPLFVSSVSAVIAFQVPITIAARSIGAAAVGAIALASQLTQATQRVDDIVTHAMYPAVCAVRDRADLLFESFSKSNRLALVWGFPVGIGAALFAMPIVHLVLGQRWDLAIPLIEVLGVSAALDQIGYNWTAFARARNETRILAVGALATAAFMLAVGVPLLLTSGLSGFAIGILVGTLANLVVRGLYLTRLFPALSIARHVARAAAPTLLAAAVVGVERLLGASGSSAATGVQVGSFLLIVVLGSWLVEHALLSEATGLLRGAAGGPSSAEPAGG